MKGKKLKEKWTKKRWGTVSVHPLFFVTLVLSALTGEFLLFCCACIAAIEHECAHAFVARRYGFALDKIVLMPYGAVISGDLSGITRREDVAVCIAGPLSNLVTALFFVALWWLYPECYPYTDRAAQVSFSLFLVNLLPAYPLDGGRLLKALLRPLGEKKASIICKCVTLALSCGMLVAFALSFQKEPQISLLTFALFLFFGSWGGGSYQRVYGYGEKNLARGVEERRVALSAYAPLSSALRYLREDKLLTVVLYEGESFCGEISEEELLSALRERGENEQLLNCCPQFIKTP